MIARLLFVAAALALASAAVDPNDPFSAAAITEEPGALIPLDTLFTASDGSETTLRKIAKGRPLLVTPVQHECPNICSVTLAGLADAIDAQDRYRPGRDFAVVALGIDPKEGPAEARDDLRRLASQRRSDTGWHPIALTGKAPAIHAVTDALGYRYAWDERIGQYAHMSGTAVLTPTGTLSSWLYGIEPGSETLRKAIAQAGEGKAGGVMDQLLLLCFHYDPATGRYSLAITKAVRVAGIATVLGIGLLLFLLARRRKGKGA